MPSQAATKFATPAFDKSAFDKPKIDKLTINKPLSDKLISTEPASSDVPLIAVPELTPALSSPVLTSAPTFGALNENDSVGSGGGKRVLIAAGVILAVAALGYFGYTKLGKSTATPVPQAASTLHPAQPAASASSPVAASTGTSGHTSSTNPAVASKITATPEKLPAVAGNSPASAKKPDTAPIVVKSSATGKKSQTQAEEAEPPLAIASANDNKLTGLIATAPSSVPKLTATTLRVSQGVSQGLLIKRVQPQYPQAALAIHTQGSVLIEATIDKQGTVNNVKVLSGESILAHAAVEAVRQWRYKPYYLDGSPVEIQTQITINFKAN
jgi:TonB family protein